ncbi:MAG: ATP-binding protein [Eubacteriales bacterium]|nr:ATP-binding protein [Eubacteriales bacterium]
MEFIQNKNPYTLQFALIPPRYVGRAALAEEIVRDLVKDVPTFRCHFISGVRGSGKTVLMTDVSRRMEAQKDWISVDIANPESDIVESLARALYKKTELKSLFLNAKIDLSVLGLGISVEKSDTVAVDVEDAADIMLSALKKKGKKVLVTIDEVTYCQGIAAFSHIMSNYARKGYDIYVLMTGLPENIREIKNNKSLTFLYRAKDNELKPLNKAGIVNDYSATFGITADIANEMAELTKGYAFAFQALGYLYWKALSENEKALPKDILGEFDYYLSEFSYEKIWSKATNKEKDILVAMAEKGGEAVNTELRDMCGMNASAFSVYRDRLIRKGLVNGEKRGYLSFTLPRFCEYINNIWQ